MADPEPRAATSGGRVYFPELDGLRFVAFMSVFIYHLAPLPFHGWEDNAFLGWFRRNGWMGVDLFFVLSAFLLTVLLMEEHRRAGSIDLRAFIIRRSLRIWPLYFLVVALAFSQLGIESYLSAADGMAVEQLQKYLLPFLLFAGNISVAVLGFPESSLLGNLWTISVEEQFYLILPLALVWISARRRGVLWLAASFAATAAATRYYLTANGASTAASHFLAPARLDAFAAGIVVAVLLGNRDSIRRFSGRHAAVAIVAVISFAALIAAWSGADMETPGWHIVSMYTVGAVGCGGLLATVLLVAPIRKVLGLPALRYLGRISYGLYVYHWIGIKIGLVVVARLGMTDGIALAAGSVISFTATAAIAAASYHYFERRFLVIKSRFEIVASRAA
ncbi:MAG TPA: acyltransferase [Gemmatimonadales bacterium]|nr:acyltransferase [Gemmatimonadales bacterium]